MTEPLKTIAVNRANWPTSSGSSSTLPRNASDAVRTAIPPSRAVCEALGMEHRASIPAPPNSQPSARGAIAPALIKIVLCGAMLATAGLVFATEPPTSMPPPPAAGPMAFNPVTKPIIPPPSGASAVKITPPTTTLVSAPEVAVTPVSDANANRGTPAIVTDINKAVITSTVPPLSNAAPIHFALNSYHHDLLSNFAVTAFSIAGGTLGGVAGAAACAGYARRRRESNVNSTQRANVSISSDCIDNPVAEVQERRTCETDAIVSVAGLAVSAPEDLFKALQRAHRNKAVSPLPASAALSSIAGQNPENQDYGLGFVFTSAAHDELQVMLIADGCGGHVGGREAAYNAIVGAAEWILADHAGTIEAMCSDAVAAASRRVESVGQRYWKADEFRSTLIVLISSASHYALAYVGDGGCELRRQKGEWISLLHPHKGEAHNILTASLGPTQIGHASTYIAPRLQGDLIVLGTDGIFDVATDHERFWLWIRTATKTMSWRDALDAQLKHAATDTRFDDNMTVGLLTTPESSCRHAVAHAARTNSAASAAYAQQAQSSI